MKPKKSLVITESSKILDRKALLKKIKKMNAHIRAISEEINDEFVLLKNYDIDRSKIHKIYDSIINSIQELFSMESEIEISLGKTEVDAVDDSKLQEDDNLNNFEEEEIQ